MKDQANALGAAGVQIGTAYLRCPEAHISELHRTALKKPEPATVITNHATRSTMGLGMKSGVGGSKLDTTPNVSL